MLNDGMAERVSSRRRGADKLPTDFSERVDTLLRSHVTADVIEQSHATGTLHNHDLQAELARLGWIGGLWRLPWREPTLIADEWFLLWTELHRAGAPVDGVQLSEMAAAAVLRHGSTAQVDRIVRGVTRGETVLSLGLTEPDAGSDLNLIRTLAVPDGDGYRLRGTKMFTTLAHVADAVFLLARLPGTMGASGMTMFVVPMDTTGISVERIDTLGDERTNATYYDDVFVTADARVGGEGDGWKVLLTCLNIERALVASYLGQIEALLDAAAQSGVRLAEHWKNYEIVGRSLCRLVVEEMSSDQNLAMVAAAAKCLVTESLVRTAREVLGEVGWPGLVPTDGPGAVIERTYRHSHVTTIYSGSSEMQRNVIARSGLGLR